MTVWFPDGTPHTPILVPQDVRDLAPGDGRSTLTVSFVAAAQMPARRAEWRSLERRSAEPNVFFGADFALSACRHIKGSDQPVFLLVHDTRRPEGDQLVGLMPVVSEQRRGSAPAFGSWCNPFTTLGTPLVDCHRTTDILTALLDALAARHGTGAVLAFRCLDTDGVIATSLRALARRSGRPLGTTNATDRAVLVPAGGAPSSSTARRRKELNRLRRRLGESGTVSVRITEAYASVRPALEQFLHLEVAGWKGIRGTALVQDPGLASFVRTAIWALADQGEARLAELCLDGRPIASTIIMIADRTAFLWKIAYDESYAKFGPGVLLIEEASRTLLEEGIVAIDSCARQGNAMIESLWPGRRHLADILVGAGAGDQTPIQRKIEVESFRSQCRERAKTVYRRLRGWTH